MKNLIIDIFVAQSDGQTDLDAALTDFCSLPIQNVWTHIKLYICKVCVGQGHVCQGLDVSIKNLIIDIFVAQIDGQTDLDAALTDFCSPPIFLLCNL